MVNATPWLLYPRETDVVRIAQETPGPVWTGAENLKRRTNRKQDKTTDLKMAKLTP